MPALDTFAVLHDIPEPAVAKLRSVMPDVRFLVGSMDDLPEGIGAATAAAVPINGSGAFDALLSAAPKLAWLQARGAGVEGLMTTAFAASGIVLTNASGNHSINIAEHVLGLMLAFARQFPLLIRSQAVSRWAKPQREKLFELSGQTLAIVGLGDIGREVAVRAAAFGMTVIGVRRSAGGEQPPGVSRSVAMGELDAVLAEADHVLNALPDTPQTERLFDADRFAAMRRGAHFYNVGRGTTVDQVALNDALKRGQVGGAGLDVTEPEPLPSDSPLWLDPNVIITSHSAGWTPKSMDRYLPLLIDNIGRWRRDEPLRNVVNVTRGY